VKPSRALAFAGIGAIQYGVMYVAYIVSYRYLSAAQVAVLTITTPVYVTLTADALQGVFRVRFLLAALLAVGGAAAVVGGAPGGAWQGVVLVQVSNAAFAIGQVGYRRLRGTAPADDGQVFWLLYAGGVLFSAAAAAWATPWSRVRPDLSQWITLLYLGIIPSGVCFFLWNCGARGVNTGTLAAMNNIKIPLAVLVAVACFGEQVRWMPLAAGAVMMLAALAAARKDGAGAAAMRAGGKDRR
jgi:drug/metabolite transporter (DMT)-like permease